MGWLYAGLESRSQTFAHEADRRNFDENDLIIHESTLYVFFENLLNYVSSDCLILIFV